MRGLITIALLLIVGKVGAADQIISVQHDSVRGVTCWIVMNTGISCLPDSSLLQTTASTTTGEDQALRASMATSMCQSEQLPATPLPQKKGFQL